MHWRTTLLVYMSTLLFFILSADWYSLVKQYVSVCCVCVCSLNFTAFFLENSRITVQQAIGLIEFILFAGLTIQSLALSSTSTVLAMLPVCRWSVCHWQRQRKHHISGELGHCHRHHYSQHHFTARELLSVSDRDNHPQLLSVKTALLFLA